MRLTRPRLLFLLGFSLGILFEDKVLDVLNRLWFGDRNWLPLLALVLRR